MLKSLLGFWKNLALSDSGNPVMILPTSRDNMAWNQCFLRCNAFPFWWFEVFHWALIDDTIREKIGKFGNQLKFLACYKNKKHFNIEKYS